MSVGRPLKYNPLVHIPLVQDLMSKGYWNYEIAAVFDITYKTLTEWRREYEDFSEAFDKGKAKRAMFWSQLGKEAVLTKDKNFQFKPWISFMNNQMQEEGWGIGEEGRRGSANTTNININNMNVLQTKDSTELLEMLQNKLEGMDPKVKELLPIQIKVINNDPE